jgi:hypothetical protein
MKNERLVNEHEVFRSSVHAEKLVKDGVIQLPIIDKIGLDAIKSMFDSFHPGGELPGLFDNIHMTTWHSDADYKNQIRIKLQEIISPYFDVVFHNYRAIGHQFIVKLPGEETTFPIHQDWCIVNEANYFSFNIWIPLHDVDQTNGAMWIVKGSHKLHQPIRGAGKIFPNYFPILPDLKSYMTNFPMKAGDGLVFYHSTIHGSPANVSQEPRITVQVAVLPKDAPLEIYFQQSSSMNIEVHHPEDNFNYNYTDIRTESALIPPTKKPVKIIENYSIPIPTISDITLIQKRKINLLFHNCRLHIAKYIRRKF